MARKLIVEIVGDSRSLEKSLDRSSKKTKKFGQDMGRVDTVLASGKKSALGMASGYLAVGAAAGGAAAFLRSSVDAALEAEKAQTRLRSAVDATGQSFDAHRSEIERVIARTSKLAALDDEDLSDSFARLVRTTGSVSKGLEGMALAADIARARGIDLAAATNIVEKANVGQLRGLKSVGIEITATTTKTEALRLAQEKFAGSAAKFGKTNAAAIDRLNVSFENLKESVGGVALPLLTDFVETLEAGTVAAGKLGGALRRIPVPKGFGDAFGSSLFQGIKESFLPGSGLFGLLKKSGEEGGKAYAQGFTDTAGSLLTEGVTKPTFGSFPYTGPKGVNITAGQRNQFFDARTARELDRVQDIVAGTGRIARLRAIQDELKARLAITNDTTRRLTLEDEILSITRQIKGEQATIAATQAENTRLAKERARVAKEAARAAAKERAERAALLRENKQFRVLGLGPGGAELIPNEAQLRRRVEKLGTKGGVVTKKIRSLLGDSFKGLSQDVRRVIDDMLDQIDDALKKHTDTGPITKYKKANTQRLLAGLGLSPDQIRAIQDRFSPGFGGNVIAPRSGVGAFGVVVDVEMDGEKVTKKVTVRQQTQRARNPPQKRGSGTARAA